MAKTTGKTTHVPMSRWGKDHWSTFAYAETRCVDHGGRPDNDHMRTDGVRHPALVGPRNAEMYLALRETYPTHLAGGELLDDHDDWDCIRDAEAEGLIKDDGSGLLPLWKMTPAGRTMAGALREHKAGGGTYATFRPPLTVEEGGDV